MQCGEQCESALSTCELRKTMQCSALARRLTDKTYLTKQDTFNLRLLYDKCSTNLFGRECMKC